jgi:hypothetical protein
VPVRLVLVALVAILLVSACNSASTNGLPSRSDAIAYFTGQGFTASESPRPNAQAPATTDAGLWVSKGPNDALAEISGSGETVDWVSLSVDVQGVGGDLLDAFLKRFAPGSGNFYGQVLEDTSSGSQDQSRTIGGRRVRIQTIGTGDSYLIAITVSAPSVQGSGR